MDLLKTAKELGIRYFLVSYSDILGTSRSKLIPASAIPEVAEKGAPLRVLHLA